METVDSTHEYATSPIYFALLFFRISSPVKKKKDLNFKNILKKTFNFFLKKFFSERRSVVKNNSEQSRNKNISICHIYIYIYRLF